MIMPPSFRLLGNKTKASTLISQARQLYNFITNQAEVGGIGFFAKTFKLEDGSIISITTSKSSPYDIRTGKISIFGTENIISISKFQFLLYPNTTRPFWQKKLRTETWTQNSNPNNKHVRLVFKDANWLPVVGYTLNKIYPRDNQSFLFLVPTDADVFLNSSNYIWKLNEVVLDTFTEVDNTKEWTDGTSDISRRVSISSDPNNLAEDEQGNIIGQYHYATILGGFGGIVDLNEQSLVDPLFIAYNSSLITRIRVYKKKPDNTIGALVGDVTYETISADENFLYRSEVNTTEDSFKFFSIFKTAPGIDRINKPENKDVHYIIT